MTSMTVEAVQLTKHYGARSAVEDVSFEASEGEIVGLLGPNGAAVSRLLGIPRPQQARSGDASAYCPRAVVTQHIRQVGSICVSSRGSSG
jgi:gliding motility-associated transport system ATP-binding protein